MDLQKVIKKMINEKMTIRDMAKQLKMSKSTLHRRITRIKSELDFGLYYELNGLFENNKKKNQFNKKEKVEEN